MNVPAYRLILFATSLILAGSCAFAAGPESRTETKVGELGAPPSQTEEWRAGAERGEAQAQYNLGLALLEGSGATPDVPLKKDNKKAVSLIAKAAAQDFEPAMYWLGIIYTGGFGFDADLDRSYCWFERAARFGYSRGYFALGRIYFQGIGRPKDLIKAHAFLTLGQGAGHQPSVELLKQVLDELSKETHDVSFVDMSIEFINKWGGTGAPVPNCSAPTGESHQ